jgi:1-acyl-sn-glycerol-3-phosphate acyltransferase
MNGVRKHPVRVGARLAWLAGESMWAALSFIPSVLFLFRSSDLEARARWLQAGCRRVLRIFNVRIRVTGPIPDRGLLVSNHLSYLDILVLSSLTPSIFVAKRDVKNWLVFGWFARLAGTLFADRERRIQVGRLAGELRTRLDKGALVVLFPEGTSSNGSTVLPFKSALLEPATNASHPVSASLIQYQLEDGNVGEEVCYWKDMTFIPHLLNLLSKRRIKASVCFAGPQSARTNRKELARHLHSEVLKLGNPGYCPALS